MHLMNATAPVDLSLLHNRQNLKQSACMTILIDTCDYLLITPSLCVCVCVYIYIYIYIYI